MPGSAVPITTAARRASSSLRPGAAWAQASAAAVRANWVWRS